MSARKPGIRTPKGVSAAKTKAFSLERERQMAIIQAWSLNKSWHGDVRKKGAHFANTSMVESRLACKREHLTSRKVAVAVGGAAFNRTSPQSSSACRFAAAQVGFVWSHARRSAKATPKRCLPPATYSPRIFAIDGMIRIDQLAPASGRCRATGAGAVGFGRHLFRTRGDFRSSRQAEAGAWLTARPHASSRSAAS